MCVYVRTNRANKWQNQKNSTITSVYTSLASFLFFFFFHLLLDNFDYLLIFHVRICVLYKRIVAVCIRYSMNTVRKCNVSAKKIEKKNQIKSNEIICVEYVNLIETSVAIENHIVCVNLWIFFRCCYYIRSWLLLENSSFP